MAKAKKKNKNAQMHRDLKEFAGEHMKRHDADRLLDGLEQRAKRVIQDNANRDASLAARYVLDYVQAARNGDVTAAILAERYSWRMTFHEHGMAEALGVADRYAVQWRGKAIDCGERSQHKLMLEILGDSDSVDLQGFMRDAGFKSVGNLRKAFTTLAQHIPGYRFTVSEKRSQIVVKKIT